jgi:tRNA(Arg) A34 adenosine deaminase TadA
LHAEIGALVRCRKHPHTLYVARVDARLHPAMARPCPICMEAIRKAGVEYVYFTMNENEGGTIFVKSL